MQRVWDSALPANLRLVQPLPGPLLEWTSTKVTVPLGKRVRSQVVKWPKYLSSLPGGEAFAKSLNFGFF